MNKIVGFFLVFLFFSCNSSKEAEPIRLHKDQCEFCKMNISDGRFGAEIITQKGRVYKFDDVRCLVGYVKESNADVAAFYVNDFTKDNVLIDAKTAHFLKGGDISSPMRGNIAGFSNPTELEDINKRLNAQEISWNDVLNTFK